MKKIILALTISLLSLGATAEPTFEETREWIMSKLQRYSWNYETRDYLWSTFSDKPAVITECEIKSTIFFAFENRKRRGSGHWKYSNYKLAEMKYVWIEKPGEDRNHWDNFGRVKIDFNYAVGDFKQYNSYFRDNNGTTKSKRMLIYFNYKNGENNLQERMINAFKHLSKLAKANPRCVETSETF